MGIALILIGHSFRLCGRPHQTQQTFLKKTESDFSDFTNFSWKMSHYARERNDIDLKNAAMDQYLIVPGDFLFLVKRLKSRDLQI